MLLPMKITWVENTAIFRVEHRKRGMQSTGTGKVDFDDLNIDRHGFLEDVLREYEGVTLDRYIYNQTVLCLNALKYDNRAVAILSSPANSLRQQDILYLFEAIEDHISTLAIKHKNAASTQYRHIFLRTGVRLGNGDPINDVPFISHFHSCHSIAFKTENGVLNQDRLILIDHSNDTELQDKVLTAMKEDLAEIEVACWDIISKFLVVRRHHCELISLIQGCLDQSDIQVSEDQVEHDNLYKVLYKIESKKLYRYKNLAQRVLDRGEEIASVFGCAANGFEEFRKIPHLSHEEYFAAYYLPKAAVEAIEVLFIIYTGWNPDSVISISEKNIIRHHGQFEIHSVKSKNDQLLQTRVLKTEKPKFHEAIELILENQENVKRYWKRSSDSIFATWSSTKYRLLFRTLTDGQHIKYIIKPYGLNHFSKKQLRDQVANIVYLETNDPFYIREFLGHASLQTTIGYLNQHVVRILNEANIRRFQDRLAATVIWTVSGNDEVVKRGLNLKDIDSRLLFPVGRNHRGADALCDRWIRCLGKFKFTIGRDEIAHLNWQRKFYLMNMARLKSENPKGFLVNHLPRILFAIALFEYVKCSPYSNLLDTEVVYDKD